MHLKAFQAKENLDLRNFRDGIFRKENSLNKNYTNNFVNFGMLYKEKKTTVLE